LYAPAIAILPQVRDLAVAVIDLPLQQIANLSQTSNLGL
jgi:hypothetical protein